MLNSIMNQLPAVKFMPKYNPSKFPNMYAITYDGQTIDGKKTKVFAYIGYPDNTTCEKFPAVVLVHGGGGHAFIEWVRLWNEAGYAAIAMDTTGFYPKCQDAGRFEESVNWVHGINANADFYEDGYVDAPTNDAMGSSELDLDKQWMYHAVSDTILAHNILLNDKRIDSNKIGITGISWGGVITSLAIGYDARYAFAIPIYGSGYLAESLGYLNKNFNTEPTKKLWLAEKNFDKVNMPVLWFCWNDDTSFSIDANSKSYRDTVKNNPLTLLSMKNNMNHSHHYGWIWSESYAFADSIIKNTVKLPTFIEQPNKIETYGNENITANVYYLTEEMTYSVHNKYGYGNYPFMDQEWMKIPAEIKNNIVTFKLPDDATSYYVELIMIINDNELTTTSEYIIK